MAKIEDINVDVNIDTIRVDGWQTGPLPPGKKTWNWGAIVTKDMVSKRATNMQPMLLCGFNGDHATLVDGTIVKGEDIAFYNNSLTLPKVELVAMLAKD